ncbi:MAG: dipeptidase PepE [Gemmatimonadales bacterium]|jgi:dipeptidase E
MPSPRLLLLSNSRNAGQGYLAHAESHLKAFLGSGVRRMLFVPYAAVRVDFDEYTAMVAQRFGEMGCAVEPIHRARSPKAALRKAEAIVVGGGNTFQLLATLHAKGLVEAIRDRVRAGAPYIGWSAGANVACPTMKTTNDMPIVEPKSLRATGLVRFQINPHYLDVHPQGHGGETREERLLEFIAANPGIFVVGLREGSILRVEEGRVALLGEKSARLFLHGRAPWEVGPRGDLGFLMRPAPKR